MTGRTGERVLYSLRLKIFAQLQRLGLDYYERELTGRIMTRMTTDVDALSTFLQTGLVTAFVSVVTFFGIMVALLVIDVQLALVVFATLPPLVVGTFFFRRASVKAYELARERGRVGQRRPPGVGVRAADRAGVPARADAAPSGSRERSDSYRQARVRGQWLISRLLPVRAAAVVGGRGGRADRRRGPGRRGDAHDRRAGRLPPLHRPVLRARAAALPGLRRLPAGDRLAGPDPGTAPGADLDPGRRRAAGRARRCAARSPSRTCDFALRRRGRRRGPRAASTCASRPARPSPSSARPARASPPWSSWSPGSTTRPAAGSPSTARTCASGREPSRHGICARLSGGSAPGPGRLRGRGTTLPRHSCSPAHRQR